MSKATTDKLDELHGVLAQKLLDRIQSGEATAADFSAARQFLKDNGIEAVVAPNTATGNLAAALPFNDDDDTHEGHPVH